MTDKAMEKVKALARRCAHSDLKLRDAQNLFNTLYFADALKNSSGNIKRAADSVGVSRTAIMRRRLEAEKARGDK